MAAQGIGYWAGRNWVWIRRLLLTTLLLIFAWVALGSFLADKKPKAVAEATPTPEQQQAHEDAKARNRAETLAAYEPIAADTKKPARDRLEAIGKVAAVDPEKGAALEPVREKLQAAVDRELRVNREKIAADERTRKKREGVFVGMTAADVLASSWGRPESVNRTTTAMGVNEQWVYGGGNYLYFTNGKLTAIQN